jgi:TolB-like protein
VISRTSVLAYRNPEGRNLKKIGDELGVATVLEGSVQRVGSKVHLNVQLIDARTDDHIWADSYTEELTDVFSIESSLAQQISTALKASFTTDEQALIARRADAEPGSLRPSTCGPGCWRRASARPRP